MIFPPKCLGENIKSFIFANSLGILTDVLELLTVRKDVTDVFLLRSNLAKFEFSRRNATRTSTQSIFIPVKHLLAECDIVWRGLTAVAYSLGKWAMREPERWSISESWQTPPFCIYTPNLILSLFGVMASTI